MVENSYPVENVGTAASESPGCIMQVIKLTSKKNPGFLNSYFTMFFQPGNFIQKHEKINS